MSNHEIPHESPLMTAKPLRFRPVREPDQKQAWMFFCLLCMGLLIALTGLVAGFMYGDAYGRKHAQYDNPVLREYYAGQCYAFWDNHLKKTMNLTLNKFSSQERQSVARLDEIRTILADLQQNMAAMTPMRDSKTSKKKVASTSSNQAVPLLP